MSMARGLSERRSTRRSSERGGDGAGKAEGGGDVAGERVIRRAAIRRCEGGGSRSEQGGWRKRRGCGPHARSRGGARGFCEGTRGRAGGATRGRAVAWRREGFARGRRAVVRRREGFARGHARSCGGARGTQRR
ncbi:hypothetical protein GUJ93_ZPchr0008g12877 [Zizania palustris]|uniref:Uncharacterized protein n=1 Tax=Zizania palustris TaxID=103762 RepID=A0A8J5V256_ZIZPA|nr:hypothetical protein GUJ93_ZPchr0008g12877 [Zizania palustris]